MAAGISGGPGYYLQRPVPDSFPTATRTSAILQEMGALENAIDILSNEVATLTERLDPLLVPLPMAEGNSNSAPEPAASMLLQRIQHGRRTLEMIHMRLVNLRSSLEI